MVKLFNKDHTFQHPFSCVTMAFFRKYPNPLAPQLKIIDTIERKLDEKGRLVISRLLTCHKGVPSWLVPFGVSPYAHIVETTTVDPVNQKMIVRSRNLTGSSLITVNENCVYTQSEENPEWTQYKASAEISAFLPFISGKFEKYSHDTMFSNADKGAQALENICNHINMNGVLSLIPSPFVFCETPEEGAELAGSFPEGPQFSPPSIGNVD